MKKSVFAFFCLFSGVLAGLALVNAYNRGAKDALELLVAQERITRAEQEVRRLGLVIEFMKSRLGENRSGVGVEIIDVDKETLVGFFDKSARAKMARMTFQKARGAAYYEYYADENGLELIMGATPPPLR